MTDATNTKVKALELAIQRGGETPAEVVSRATAYNAFLSGSAAPAAGTATGANKAAGAATGGATTNKTPAADKDKGAASKTDAEKAAEKAAATAAAKAAAAKANTAKTPAAGAAGNKPAAGAPTGAAVPPDTKAPGGKNTYADVVNALRKVKDKSSKEDAVAILVEDGGGAKSVRDLKPALYDAVVEACNNVLEGDGADAAAGGQVEDPTAQPERDELGL